MHSTDGCEYWSTSVVHSRHAPRSDLMHAVFALPNDTKFGRDIIGRPLSVGELRGFSPVAAKASAAAAT